jgi:hypothetical protein
MRLLPNGGKAHPFSCELKPDYYSTAIRNPIGCFLYDFTLWPF